MVVPWSPETPVTSAVSPAWSWRTGQSESAEYHASPSGSPSAAYSRWMTRRCPGPVPDAEACRSKGRMMTTGKLGDVMKESIDAARSFVRSRAASYGIAPPM